jgi:imidazoleglycerol-phosphate dehydratase/histidinol-phosphatase
MKKVLFVDRDGTLLEEPSDFQIDSLAKFRLVRGVVPALLRLRDDGYRFVMVSNQDGLGTDRYPQARYDEVQALLLSVLETQGIVFESVRICPHLPDDRCTCRKPGLGLVLDYLADAEMDRKRSWVVGDRATDLELARTMGIQGAQLGPESSWAKVAACIVLSPRVASCVRTTRETTIRVDVNLDAPPADTPKIATGIGFFDHMLDQIGRHGGFELEVAVTGDLHVDDHHTVEDTALALGVALRDALGDKRGIERFGSYIPMDDASAQVAVDLSGRPFCRFDATFERETVGGLATEMVPHFFRSLADGLRANIHVRIDGENTHHRVEAAFKGLGRSLRSAIARTGAPGIPSTKGAL